MAWITLFFAGLLEIVWAYFMKQSNGFTKVTPTILAVAGMIASFTLLAYSMRTLPLGTAYAMWTGIGAVGSIVAGIIFFGDPMNAPRILATLLIVSGLLLMKLSPGMH